MNPVQAIVDFLREDVGVAALVADRVFYALGRVVRRSDFPCVLVSRIATAGRDPDDTPPVEPALFDIRCYGVDQPQAQEVAAAVRAALHGATFRPAGESHTLHGAAMRLEGADIDDAPDNETTPWNCVLMTVEIEVEAES